MSAPGGTAEIGGWRGPCCYPAMWTKLARLLVIRTKFDAFCVLYALALGATERGAHYLQAYPGPGGRVLFLASTAAVFMAGARVLDSVEREARE